MSVEDRSRILSGLWQGSCPETGPAVARAGFAVLVLCADEYQLVPGLFPGTIVLHCPLFDDGRTPTPEDLDRAVACARRVATLHARGARVIVTCMAGWNRSGLVSALAARYLTGETGMRMRRLVQICRSGALSNAAFCDFLDRLDRPTWAPPPAGRALVRA